MDREVVIRMLLEKGSFIIKYVNGNGEAPLSVTLGR